MFGGGKAWVVGDDIDTDVLAPGAYMKGPLDALAAHCLEAVSPGFASSVRPGDVLVAGRNFGIGSSREQAAQALAHLGVAAVIARSFGGIFHRNAINLGLPVIVSPAAAEIGEGDRVAVDPRAGVIENRSKGRTLDCEPLPDFLMRILEAGGLVPYLERRFRAERKP